MAIRKITPESFNDAAWNLGLPLRWIDHNNNSQIDEEEEMSSIGIDLFAGMPNSKTQLRRLIEEGATGEHLAVVRTPKYIASLDKKVEEARVSKDPEKLRTALRDRDMAYRGWAYHNIDFSKLPPSEQKAAWLLLQEVMPAVEGVHALQNDPNNLKYLQEIAATGNFDDYVHAWYSGGPWCQEIQDSACGSHRNMPVRVPHAATWPETYTTEHVEALQNSPDTKEKDDLLSNFVTRYLDTNGKLQWRALNADKGLRPYLTQISEGMRKAAEVPDIDPSLQKFLEARADEFGIATDPYPFYYGDTAWIAMKGGLDVTLGFYEVDDSPFETTGWMQGYVGPIENEWEEKGKQFQQLVPEMEKNVAVELGKTYTPRDFSKGLPPLRFARLVGSGDPRVKYVPAGYYLPNLPVYRDPGTSKKVFGMNHQVARLEGVMRPMGDLVIHPSQRNVSDKDFSNFVVAHENAHGVGPRITERNLASPIRGALEEAKADQEGMAALPLAVQNGLMTKEEADQTCVAMVYSLLRGLSYGMSDSHGIGSFLEFTTHYQQGGIVEKGGYYMANLSNGACYKAAEKVARRIEKIQLRSLTDSTGAQKEAEEWLSQAKRDLPAKMKTVFLPQLVQMPKDVLPWYHFEFSPGIALEMRNNSRELAGSDY